MGTEKSSASTITEADLSVQRLRELGYKVKATHFRFVNDFTCFESKRTVTKHCYPTKVIRDGYAEFHAKGGATEVCVLTPEGEELNGESFCHLEDHFVKSKGIRYALADAFGIDLVEEVKVEVVD